MDRYQKRGYKDEAGIAYQPATEPRERRTEIPLQGAQQVAEGTLNDARQLEAYVPPDAASHTGDATNLAGPRTIELRAELTQPLHEK